VKFYIYLAVLGALAIGGVIYTYWIYDMGRNAEKARNAMIIEEYRDNQKRLVERLEEANAKERIVVRERIKTVRTAVDPSGCADQRIPDSILNGLQ